MDFEGPVCFLEAKETGQNRRLQRIDAPYGTLRRSSQMWTSRLIWSAGEVKSHVRIAPSRRYLRHLCGQL